MSKILLAVTKVVATTDKGAALTSVRLMIDGRSMWLNVASVAGAKLVNKDTQLETDDTVFNGDKLEVLKCSNEHGAYLKLVPKTAFKLAAF